MRTVVTCLSVLVTIGIPVASAPGQAPEKASCTLWTFLGIPKGLPHTVKDCLTNRHGLHPGCERKPPLKRIADPANLESGVPAIKTAAEIKQKEDQAQQEIKAIRYLAQLGCGCHDKDGKVTKALLAALDNPTEKVRFEAARAVVRSAKGERCRLCKTTSCCGPDIVEKLTKVAHGKNDNGCWIEPSARVQREALRALRACGPMQPAPAETPATAEPEPEKPEPERPAPEKPAPEGPAPEEPKPEGPASDGPVSDRSAAKGPASEEPEKPKPESVPLGPKLPGQPASNEGSTPGDDRAVSRPRWSPNRPSRESSILSDSRSLLPPRSQRQLPWRPDRPPRPDGTGDPADVFSSVANHADSARPVDKPSMARGETTQPAKAFPFPPPSDATGNMPAQWTAIEQTSLPQQSSALDLRGTLLARIGQVDPTKRTLDLDSVRHAPLPLGLRATVLRQYLFGSSVVGGLEVVASGPSGTKFEPVDKMTLSNLRRGDILVVAEGD